MSIPWQPSALRARVSRFVCQKSYAWQPTVLAHVTALLIDVLEFSQCFDNINVFARPCDDELGALVQAVVEHLE
jgi:hypothetical protein